MSARSKGIGLVLLSAIGYGLTPILLKLAYAEGAQLYQILYYRFLLAALLLTGQLLYKRRLTALSPRQWGLAANAFLLGGSLFAGITLCLFTSMQYLSASVSELLYFIYPVWVGALSALLYKKKPTKGQWACVWALLAGIFLTLDLQGAAVSPLGVGFALLSSFCSAAYVLFAKRSCFAGLDGYVFSLAVMAGSLVWFAGFYFGQAAPHPAFTGKAVLVVMVMTLASTLLAMCSYFLGIRYLAPVEVAALAGVEPIVTVLCETFLLGSRMGVRVYCGAALVIGAITLFTLAEKRPSGGNHKI